MICLLFLFYFTSPLSSLSSPELITSGPSLGCFQHSEIVTRPATALVSSLVNHCAGQGEKAIGARGQRWRCSFSIHPSHLPRNQFTVHQRHSGSTTAAIYERGGEELLRERRSRAGDSFRHNLINVTHRGFLSFRSPSGYLNPVSSTGNYCLPITFIYILATKASDQ